MGLNNPRDPPMLMARKRVQTRLLFRKKLRKSQKLKNLHYLSTNNQLFVTFVAGSSKLQKENNYGFQIKVQTKLTVMNIFLQDVNLFI